MATLGALGTDRKRKTLVIAEGIELVTGDRRLLRTVARYLPWVRWIGDL